MNSHHSVAAQAFESCAPQLRVSNILFVTCLRLCTSNSKGFVAAYHQPHTLLVVFIFFVYQATVFDKKPVGLFLYGFINQNLNNRNIYSRAIKTNAI